MDKTLQDVLGGLRELAVRHGWTEVERSADALRREPSTRQLTVAVPVASSASSAASFQRWLAEQLPAVEVATVPLTRSLLEPGVGLEADQLLLLVPCGHLLSGEEGDAIERVFHCRPSGSYAFVLTEAEQIEDAEDLALVERGAWRLLVPDPRPEWNHQRLAEHGCFLWSSAEAMEYGGERVRDDMEALYSWIKASAPNGSALRRAQSILLLNRARELSERGGQAGAALSDALTDPQLRDVHERVIELRRRWTRRLDADADAIERHLVTSLQTMELQMRRNLPAFLEAEFRRSEVRTGRDLKALLTRYLNGWAQTWSRDSQEFLERRREEIAADTESLLGSVNWTHVNRVLQQRGAPCAYPQALWANIAAPSHLGAVAADVFGEPEDMAYQAPSQGASRVRMATTGAVVSTVAMFLLGIGPLGVIAGCTGAALSGVVLSDRMQKGQALQQSLAFGERAIREVIQAASLRVREETARRFHLVRASVRSDLELLEKVLEDARRESRRGERAAHPPGPGGTPCAQIDDYLRQLTLTS